MNTFDFSANVSSNLRPEVVVCGPAWVDYQLELDGAPQADRFSQILREDRSPGGMGALGAALLATWGARVVLVAPDFGDDANGRFAHRELAAIPNLSIRLPENRTDETPYRVLLVPPAGAPCELWRGQLTQLMAGDEIPGTSSAALMIDDRTVTAQSFVNPAGLLFVCIESVQSTLGQGAALVWIRKAHLSNGGLCNYAARFSTTAVTFERQFMRCSVRGECVQQLPLPGPARDDKNTGNTMEGAWVERVWTAFIWGYLNDWDFKKSLFFAQAVGEVPLETRIAMPSLLAISEAARGMLK